MESFIINDPGFQYFKYFRLFVPIILQMFIFIKGMKLDIDKQ